MDCAQLRPQNGTHALGTRAARSSAPQSEQLLTGQAFRLSSSQLAATARRRSDLCTVACVVSFCSLRAAADSAAARTQEWTRASRAQQLPGHHLACLFAFRSQAYASGGCTSGALRCTAGGPCAEYTGWQPGPSHHDRHARRHEHKVSIHTWCRRRNAVRQRCAVRSSASAMLRCF